MFNGFLPHQGIFVHQEQRSAIAAQAKQFLQILGRLAFLRRREIPSRFQPIYQRNVGILEKGSNRYGSLVVAVLAFIFSLTNLPGLAVMAPGTAVALWPAKAGQIVEALLFCAEFLLKLL